MLREEKGAVVQDFHDSGSDLKEPFFEGVFPDFESAALRARKKRGVMSQNAEKTFHSGRDERNNLRAVDRFLRRQDFKLK